MQKYVLVVKATGEETEAEPRETGGEAVRYAISTHFGAPSGRALPAT